MIAPGVSAEIPGGNNICNHIPFHLVIELAYRIFAKFYKPSLHTKEKPPSTPPAQRRTHFLRLVSILPCTSYEVRFICSNLTI